MEQQQPVTTKGNSFAQAAIVIGLVSIFLGIVSGLGGVILGALGVTFAMLSRGEKSMLPSARMGMIASLVGMILGVILLVMMFTNGAFSTVTESSGVI